jgi:hypothetical protein
MTAMLTIMSDMDPHTIRETWVCLVRLMEVCGMFDVTFEEKSFSLSLSHSSFWHSMQPLLSASLNYSQPFLV